MYTCILLPLIYIQKYIYRVSEKCIHTLTADDSQFLFLFRFSTIKIMREDKFKQKKFNLNNTASSKQQFKLENSSGKNFKQIQYLN